MNDPRQPVGSKGNPLIASPNLAKAIRREFPEVEVMETPMVRERFGQSALPRFNRYSIVETLDPKAVDCPYCIKRPRNLAAHCRAQHPDKPEARQ